MPSGTVDLAGATTGAHRAGDAGEPEDPGRAAVPVVAHDVPVTVPGHDAPRLDVPLADGGLTGVR